MKYFTYLIYLYNKNTIHLCKVNIQVVLQQFMKTVTCLNTFDRILIEIDSKNHRSLKAHESIGFVYLKDFNAGDKNWRIVSLKV
jgi:hypothetical protein